MRRTADFHYHLPAEQIAQAPADRRDASRLLEVSHQLFDRRFTDLPALLPEGAVLVVNDTRVIPARLRGEKPTGGAVELLLVEPAPGAPGERWRCLARSSKPLRVGAEIALGGGHRAVVVEPRGEDGALVIELDAPALAIAEAVGEVPLPPYISRPGGPGAADRERYQTVFAANPGAVAAPTAGLHFTAEILAALGGRGIEVAPVTLHVGPGTFAPIRDGDIERHRMHGERYRVPEATRALLGRGRPVVAVGTTVVRALEAAARGPAEGVTELFIRPGFEFQVVDHLLTNFHLPGSTLIMLVCAFAGYEPVMSAYRHAVAEGYRFYSYGDAMLVHRC